MSGGTSVIHTVYQLCMKTSTSDQACMCGLHAFYTPNFGTSSCSGCGFMEFAHTVANCPQESIIHPNGPLQTKYTIKNFHSSRSGLVSRQSFCTSTQVHNTSHCTHLTRLPTFKWVHLVQYSSALYIATPSHAPPTYLPFGLWGGPAASHWSLDKLQWPS